MKHWFARRLIALLIAALLLAPAALAEAPSVEGEAIGEAAGEATSEAVPDEETVSDEDAVYAEAVASDAVDAVVTEGEETELDGGEDPEPDVALYPDEAYEIAEAAEAAEAAGAAYAEAEAQTEAAEAQAPRAEAAVALEVFKDTIFRQLVLNNFDTDKDGALSQAELDAVTTIDVTDRGIADLSGIDAFRNLRQLYCEQNMLTTLDVGGNPLLETLCCSGNYLASLNIGANVNLKTLQCHDNKLTVLDVSGCPGITAYIKQTCYALVDGIVKYTAEDGHCVLWCDSHLAITGGEPVTGTIRMTGNAKKKVPVGTTHLIDLNGETGKKFKSSRKSVATVDQTGLITAKSAGKTKITFKVGRKERTLTLTVTDPTVPNSVVLNMTGTVSWFKQDPLTLTATVPNGTYSSFKWSSSNRKVATVKGGVVKFKKAGKVTITVTCARGGKQDDVTFRVVDGGQASAIAIVPPESTTLKVGESIKLTASATIAKPSDENNPTKDPTASWTSSNAKVAAINKKTGVLKAKKPGTVTITVTAGSKKKAKIRITVVK